MRRSPRASGNIFRRFGRISRKAQGALQTVVALHRHTRLNPQLYYYFGPFGLETEYLRERQAVEKNGADSTVTNSAGHVTVAYVIGGTRTYQGSRVSAPFNLAAGTLGALEIGARYNWLTIDSAAFPGLSDPTKSVAKAKGFGGVLSWYLTQSLRLAGSYDQTAFTGGASQYDAAIRGYDKAIALQPDLTVAYHNRAIAHSQTKAYDDAWTDVRMVRRLGGTPSSDFVEELTKASGRSE